ncbi:MAG: hypothetical protein ACLPN6_23940 [Streptosporangiaceae bacterium]|jgi:hypothetical protein
MPAAWVSDTEITHAGSDPHASSLSHPDRVNTAVLRFPASLA